MSRTKKYIALDIGAESGRAIVGQFDGKKVELEEMYRFPNEPVYVSGTLHWDVLRIFHEIKNGLRACVKKCGGEYAGIGIDVSNVGKHRGEIGMQIDDKAGKNWYDYYDFIPGEECTLSVRIKEMTERYKLDPSKIKSIMFMTRRPKTDLRFQMGPLVLVPKQAEKN